MILAQWDSGWACKLKYSKTAKYCKQLTNNGKKSIFGSDIYCYIFNHLKIWWPKHQPSLSCLLIWDLAGLNRSLCFSSMHHQPCRCFFGELGESTFKRDCSHDREVCTACLIGGQLEAQLVCRLSNLLPFHMPFCGLFALPYTG